MSGIAGVAYLDGKPAGARTAATMMEAMPHRMRSGGSTRAIGSAAFAQGGSNLVELQGCLLTADARIDNRKELGSALGLSSGELAGVSDAELILRSYLEWGTGCVKKLLGDFVFGLWDERNRTLLCGRDHLGVRPLVVYQSREMIAFASEPKAILRLPEVPRQINEERICVHFFPELLFVDTTSTFQKGIERLSAGHYLVSRPEGGRIERYWSPDPFRESECRSDEEYIEEFRRLFFQSVGRRLPTDLPVGSTLSGGLDSSSVSCVARDLLASAGRSPLRTYSAIFDHVPDADERGWIEEVLKGGGIDPRQIHPDSVSPLIDLDTAIWLNDGPFYGTNYFIHWETYRHAAADGTGVMLDGEDGDTTVSHGVDHLRQQVQAGAWSDFAAECDAIVRGFDNEKNYASRLGMLRAHGLPYLDFLSDKHRWGELFYGFREVSRLFGASSRTLFLRHLVKRLGPYRWAKQVVWPGRSDRHAPDSLLSDALLKKYGVQERLAELRDSYLDPKFPAHERQSHVDHLSSGALPYTLEALDRIAAYRGIEVRHPFCDVELAQFALSVPARLKLRDGFSRYILRQALSGTLPEPIRWRTGKGDLSGVSERGLPKYERETIAALAARAEGRAFPYMDAEKVRASAVDAIETGDRESLSNAWKAILLNRWIEHGEKEPDLEMGSQDPDQPHHVFNKVILGGST